MRKRIIAKRKFVMCHHQHCHHHHHRRGPNILLVLLFLVLTFLSQPTSVTAEVKPPIQLVIMNPGIVTIDQPMEVRASPPLRFVIMNPDTNSKGRPWKGDLVRFLREAHAKHGHKYYYGKVRPEDIETAYSHVPLICLGCGRDHNPTINNFINMGSDCPCYSGNFPWKGDLNRFLTKTQEIHPDRYDCSRVRPEDIVNEYSHVLLICKGCGKNYNPTNLCLHPTCVTIVHVIQDRKSRGTDDLQRFLRQIQEIHPDRYDCSHVTEDHIK